MSSSLKKTRKIPQCFAHQLLVALIAFSTLLAASGCNSGDGVGTSNSQASSQSSSIPQGYACNFTEIDQLTVSTDPTQDFNTINALETTTIQNNTCAGISNGLQSSATLSSVTRSNGQISFIDSGGPENVYISGSQASTPESSLLGCSDGLLSTGTLAKVELNPISGQILIYINWSLLENNCTQAPDVSNLSAPAPVVIDPSPSPSPSSSPSPAFTPNVAITFAHIPDGSRGPTFQVNGTTNTLMIRFIAGGGETGASYGCISYTLNVLGQVLQTETLSVNGNDPVCAGAPSSQILNLSNLLNGQSQSVTGEVTGFSTDYQSSELNPASNGLVVTGEIDVESN